MSTIRLGVLGGGRGGSMMSYCLAAGADKVQLAAVCDKNPEVLEARRKGFEENSVACYDNFDDFINHPMDASGAVSYAHQHALRFRCLLGPACVQRGSALPEHEGQWSLSGGGTLGQGVCLQRDYCYMKGPQEMHRLTRGRNRRANAPRANISHRSPSACRNLRRKGPLAQFIFSTFYC